MWISIRVSHGWVVSPTAAVPLIHWLIRSMSLSGCVSELPTYSHSLIIVHNRQQTINGSLSNVLRKPAGEDESMEMERGLALP